MENNLVSLFNRRRPLDTSSSAVSQSVSPAQVPVIATDAAAVTRVSSQHTPTSSAPVASQATAKSPEPLGFAALAERNRINQERLRKERDQANKSVLKSYRIK